MVPTSKCFITMLHLQTGSPFPREHIKHNVFYFYKNVLQNSGYNKHFRVLPFNATTSSTNRNATTTTDKKYLIQPTKIGFRFLRLIKKHFNLYELAVKNCKIIDLRCDFRNLLLAILFKAKTD